jgi:hypothetical protein
VSALHDQLPDELGKCGAHVKDRRPPGVAVSSNSWSDWRSMPRFRRPRRWRLGLGSTSPVGRVRARRGCRRGGGSPGTPTVPRVVRSCPTVEHRCWTNEVDSGPARRRTGASVQQPIRSWTLPERGHRHTARVSASPCRPRSVRASPKQQRQEGEGGPGAVRRRVRRKWQRRTPAVTHDARVRRPTESVSCRPPWRSADTVPRNDARRPCRRR